MSQKTIEPLAILTSDVHYNIKNLEVADAALHQAVEKAEELNIPLIIAGDLHDTKAMLRAECVDRLIKTLGNALCSVYVLVGNHDMINEKGEGDALGFLCPFVRHIDKPVRNWQIKGKTISFIPYQHDSSKILDALKDIPKGSIVIMHQGVKGAYMGEYVIDKSSIDPTLLQDWRCISGHYHRTQNIGNFSYIGSPYTISFAEANDGPKGFQILYSDGSMEQVPTNLRKHLKLSFNVRDTNWAADGYQTGDVVWVKVTGPQLELEKLDKKAISETLFLGSDFKLELVPDELFIEDSVRQVSQVFTPESSADLLDSLISDSAENEQDKVQLKSLFREIME